MIGALSLTFLIVGALWWRWLGGWLGGERWWRFAALPVLVWPFWIVLPALPALLASAACGLFFAIGHTFDGWGAIKRYGPFGLGYPLAFRFWRSRWDRPPFVDGWTAAGELFLGGTFWACVPLVLWGRA